MIPLKVEVEGFLCYRDRQVVDLDGSGLWVFSGRNGSGKSAIFDAITFALYGVHRGGQQGTERLINSNATEFRVAFDFQLGTDRFRITRGRRQNGRLTRQIHRHEVEDGNGHWYPIPETDRDAGFDRWVAAHIGLNYEMFTTSILLRQGESDKFLEVQPKKRFEIVAEVADMKPYQNLHEQADARRKDRKSQLELVRRLLSDKPVIEPAAITLAETRSAEAEQGRAEAAAERDRYAAIEVQARHWREGVEAREDVLARADQARQTIAESATIEAESNRLRELDRVLVPLSEEFRRRADRADREVASAEASSREVALKVKLAKLVALAEPTRDRLAEVVEEMTRDEARRGAILDRMGSLAEPIQRANAAQARRRLMTTLEATLAGHPDDLEATAAQLAEAARQAAEWKAAMPTLIHLDHARTGLIGARVRVQAGVEAIATAEALARRTLDTRQATQQTAQAARSAQEEADHRSAETRAIFRSAKHHLDAFERLEGNPACDRCGQPLTPRHYQAESLRLQGERDLARDANEAARKALAEAKMHRDSADDVASRALELDHAAKTTLTEARRRFEGAEDDLLRFQKAADEAFAALEESFQLAVTLDPDADWATTTFPTAADLAEGGRLSVGFPEADRLARQVAMQVATRQAQQDQWEVARQALDEIGLLPGDDAAAAEHARLIAEETALVGCWKSHQQERASVESTDADLTAKISESRQEIVILETRRSGDETAREASRQASAAARSTVPAAWLAAFDGASHAEFSAWEAERDDLRRRGLEERSKELPRAHWELETAEDHLRRIDAQLAEVPAAARIAPAEITRQKAAASARVAATEAEAQDRRHELDDLRRDRDARADLEIQALAADRSLVVSTRLAELLGRGSLQRILLRDAERGILDCANQILRDISGDDLELRLDASATGDDQALTLEVIDRTHGHGRTLDVAFLSGSQKFRVAVSLALGIGQYARGLDRPIRSVIIDEGFGCLDRIGRDDMIAQLKKLKGRLDRVILVSHQEEFADAFPDGFHFEARDGSTVIEPFHR